MDDNDRKYMNHILTALEHFYLRSSGATALLRRYSIPNWAELLDEYCEREENKTHAHQRFAGARALVMLAQTDSAALEALAKALDPTGETN